MADDSYVPDRLWARLFAPWTLPEAEWPKAKEDWARIEAITALPWAGRLLDVGSGDGTLGSMVVSRNPAVSWLSGVEQDAAQVARAGELWRGWPAQWGPDWPEGMTFDGALCCEILEHLTPEDGAALLTRIHASLRPGVLCCITVPHPTGSRAAYPGHINLMDEFQVSKMAEKAGFETEVRYLHAPTEFDPCVWIMVTGYKA